MSKSSPGGMGRVAAVCSAPTAGIPKRPQAEIKIGRHGVEGDYHSGPVRKSHQTGEMKMNDRSISVLAKEVLDDVNRRLKVAAPPGGFGENILVEGVGDLSDLAPGHSIRFENGVVIEVTERNEPCANLNFWHKLVVKETLGRRGIVGVVKKEGALRPGEGVQVSKRKKPIFPPGRRPRRSRPSNRTK